MIFNGKVLIADDEVHVRKFVSVIARRLGASTVLEAENGERAVALFESESPDLTLLDVNMPRMDGIETLKRLMEINPDALVVMLTSLVNRETVEDCARLGATDYIRKDLPVEEIMAALQRIIDDAGGEPEASPEAAS